MWTEDYDKSWVSDRMVLEKTVVRNGLPLRYMFVSSYRFPTLTDDLYGIWKLTDRKYVDSFENRRQSSWLSVAARNRVETKGGKRSIFEPNGDISRVPTPQRELDKVVCKRFFKRDSARQLTTNYCQLYKGINFRGVSRVFDVIANCSG